MRLRAKQWRPQTCKNLECIGDRLVTEVRLCIGGLGGMTTWQRGANKAAPVYRIVLLAIRAEAEEGNIRGFDLLLIGVGPYSQ